MRFSVISPAESALATGGSGSDGLDECDVSFPSVSNEQILIFLRSYVRTCGVLHYAFCDVEDDMEDVT